MPLDMRSSINSMVNQTWATWHGIKKAKKRYASPGGGSKIYTELVIHWTNNLAIRVTKALLQVDNAITRLSNCGYWPPISQATIPQ